MESLGVPFAVSRTVVVAVGRIPATRSFSFATQLLGLGILAPPEYIVCRTAAFVGQPATRAFHALALDAGITLATIPTGPTTPIRATLFVATFRLAVPIARLGKKPAGVVATSGATIEKLALPTTGRITLAILNHQIVTVTVAEYFAVAAPLPRDAITIHFALTSAAMVSRFALATTLATTVVAALHASATPKTLVIALAGPGAKETFRALTTASITTVRTTYFAVAIWDAGTISTTQFGTGRGTNRVPGIVTAVVVVGDHTSFTSATATARLFTGETAPRNSFHTGQPIAIQPLSTFPAGASTAIVSALLVLATGVAASSFVSANCPLARTLATETSAVIVTTLLAKATGNTNIAAGNGVLSRWVNATRRIAVIVAIF